MAVLGNADDWADTFPDHLIPQIVELVLTTWLNLDKPTPDELETRITRQLRVALKRAKDLQRLPFIIDREIPEDEWSSAEEKGRIDLRFVAGKREDVYFALECKRLNVTHSGRCKSLAMEYVTDGMQRFTSGKYAAHLRCGGMVGYVMDGRVPAAVRSVDRAVKQMHSELLMQPPGGLAAANRSLGTAWVAMTEHRTHPDGLTLHHLFLPVA